MVTKPQLRALHIIAERENDTGICWVGHLPPSTLRVLIRNQWVGVKLTAAARQVMAEAEKGSK